MDVLELYSVQAPFYQTKNKRNHVFLFGYMCTPHCFMAIYCISLGKIACDFCHLVLFINRPHLGPVDSTMFFSNSVSNSLSYRIRNSYFAMGRWQNQIFFTDTRDFKLGWCRPSLVLIIYMHFLSSMSL